MNNIVMRKVVVTADWQPLASASLVASVVISCLPSNAGNVIFEGDGGQEVALIPGEWHQLRSVDLSTIRVKGTEGDVVTVVGGSW
jgi:hypothetical protein